MILVSSSSSIVFFSVNESVFMFLAILLIERNFKDSDNG